VQWPGLHHYQWLASAAGCCGAEHVLAFSTALVLLLTAPRAASARLTEHPALRAHYKVSTVPKAVRGVE